MPADPQLSPTRGAAHVRRVFIVLAVVVVLLFVGQRLLRPASYGDIGGYRADSLREIAGRAPVHLGKEACGECHGDVLALHAKDIHFDVECEDCHTPGRQHVLHHRDQDPAVDAEAARMPKEYTLEGCLFCHRRLDARPSNFPQIEQAEHYAFLGVNDPETRCIACHSPHEPLFVLERVKEARVHPLIQECRQCHDDTPEGDHRAVADHPAIFTCVDCHPNVVRDFEKRTHSFMRCTACHLFHYENENAGRIMKNGNRRFCLLCHEEAPFRVGARQPLIDSDAHLAAFAELLETDVETLQANPRTCLKCHSKLIHGDVGRR